MASSIRRRILITALALLLTLVALSVYPAYFCIRNARVEAAWSGWTDHLTGAPTSWQPPSNGLRRFYSDTQTFTSSSGLVGHLSGYKDESGNVVIPPRFAACGKRFYEGLAWASDPHEKRSGYINPDGSWAIIVNGTTHSSFVGGMGAFQVIGADGYPLRGFVNRQGQEVVPPQYRSVSWYVDGYVLVRERTWIGKMGDRMQLEFGASPSTCWDTRALILDKSGNVASLPPR